MFETLLLTFLPFPILLQEPPPAKDGEVTDQDPEDEAEGLEPEEEEPSLTPEEALVLLQEAFKSRQDDLILVAIEDAGQVKDKAVVKSIAAGLKSKDEEIRFATLEALRWNEDDEALKLLLKQKKNRTLLENELTAEAYYWALGQKADKKCFAVLEDDLQSNTKGDKAMQARILSLGRIRQTDSIESLIGLMTKGGKGRRGRGNSGGPHREYIFTSLEVLTGQDHRDTLSWLKWWNDNKKKYKVSKEEWQPRNKKKADQWKILWAHPDEKDLLRLALKKGAQAGDVANASDEDIERLRKKAEERKKEDVPDDEEF
jgi:hypothetical protein